MTSWQISRNISLRVEESDEGVDPVLRFQDASGVDVWDVDRVFDVLEAIMDDACVGSDHARGRYVGLVTLLRRREREMNESADSVSDS